MQALGDHLAQGETAAAGNARDGAAFDAAPLLYSGACLADSVHRGRVLLRFRLREWLAATLLRELRSGHAGTMQRREWTLRASAADPLLGTLITQEG